MSVGGQSCPHLLDHIRRSMHHVVLITTTSASSTLYISASAIYLYGLTLSHVQPQVRESTQTSSFN